MLRDFVTRSPLLAMPFVAFALFGAIFLLVLVSTLKKRARAFDDVARLPLSDGATPSKESSDVPS